MFKEGLSIFIPSYNSELIVRNNVLQIYNYFLKRGFPFEIIVVDDNSTDNSIGILKELAESYNEISYIQSKQGPSRRENLAQAFKTARFNYIMFMDIDLATKINNLDNLLEYLGKGYDIVLGSRYKGIKPTRRRYKQIISSIYNLFIRIYYRSKIYDHQCGFKSGKKEIFNMLVDEMGYSTSEIGNMVAKYL